MEQTENIRAESATSAPRLPAVRVSDRLADATTAAALVESPHRHPGRRRRPGDWTPERIRIFLDALAECGVVGDAARAAGMSRQSAYNLRNRSTSRAFHLAWSGAELLGRRRLSAEVMSRALHGCVELVVRDGEVWGERHRFDNRLTMAVLARLDRQAAALDSESRTAQIVAQEFDAFVDLVCAGGEGADRFIAEREAAANNAAGSGETSASGGAEPAGAIDLSDLDPDNLAGWTDEQRDRARRAGLSEDVLAAAESGDETAISRYRLSILGTHIPSGLRFIVRRINWPGDPGVWLHLSEPELAELAAKYGTPYPPPPPPWASEG